MWLTGRLAPDHKTIADFRRDNGPAIRRSCARFVELCRRIGRRGARELRKRFAGQIWVAGMLMVAPLSLPLINLFVPVIGAATFTHLFHRLSRER